MQIALGDGLRITGVATQGLATDDVLTFRAEYCNSSCDITNTTDNAVNYREFLSTIACNSHDVSCTHRKVFSIFLVSFFFTVDLF